MIATDHARAHQKLPERVHEKTKKHDEAFLALVRGIAFSDADQVEADWKCFRSAAGLMPDECDKPAFVPPSYQSSGEPPFTGRTQANARHNPECTQTEHHDEANQGYLRLGQIPPNREYFTAE